MTTPPDLALDIARAVRAAGGRALIVGGWVRDQLLGHPSKDLDLEVFGVPAPDLRAMLERFGRVDTVGESFTVYKIGDLDVSIPRRESKAGRGHKGFVVTGDPTLSAREAARRRDFTVNAMAWDPLADTMVDPFDGRRDLEARLLRAVDPRTFADDSLRVLRALQFAARFEFTIDDATKALCRSLPLDDLPAERVWGEIEKLLLRARRPSIGLALALELGVIDRLFPELTTLVGCEQEPEWHPEGDVWVHTLLVADQARTRIDDLDRPKAIALMLGALCHDLGKPATTKFSEGRIRSLGHEEAGVDPAHALLARLAKSDCLGRTGTFDCSAMDWFLERARALGVEHAPPAPLVLGRHLLELGVRPGPQVGQILKTIYEQQLDGQITTLDAGIALARTLTGRS